MTKSRFSDLWTEASPLTLSSLFKSENVYRLLEQTLQSGRQGDVAEFGVFKGATAFLMAAAMKENGAGDRKIFLFDSFEGLPETDPDKDGPYYMAGSMSGIDLNPFLTLTRKHNLESQVVIKKGWFDDTIPGFRESSKFCYLHVDCDIYSSTKVCLDRFYKMVVDGGVIVFDDYFDLGAGQWKAVDELVRKTGELLFAGPESQVFLIKGRRKTRRDLPFLMQPTQSSRVSLSIEHQLLKPDYFHHLEFNDRPRTIPGLRRSIEVTEYARRILAYYERLLLASKKLEGSFLKDAVATLDAVSKAVRTGKGRKTAEQKLSKMKASKFSQTRILAEVEAICEQALQRGPAAAELLDKISAEYRNAMQDLKNRARKKGKNR